jgi:hypothetical protein
LITAGDQSAALSRFFAETIGIERGIAACIGGITQKR